MIEGMNKIVATVSGYHGSERSKLIKLIDFTGAVFVGNMSRSITHLVCWKFEGKKYELAKKLGTVIVNHRWVEDCIKEGKRIPEHPYSLKSGQEVGFCILDPSALTRTADVLGENKLLLNTPSMSDRLKEVIDVDSDDIENDVWDVEWLLNENLFPKRESDKNAIQRSKRKVTKESLREAKSNSRRSIREPQIPTVGRLQRDKSDYLPRSSIKQRESDSGLTICTDVAESSRRSRRLVKKNAQRNIFESASIHAEQGSTIHGDVYELNSSQSNNSNDLRYENEASNSRRLETECFSHGESGDKGVNHLNPDDTHALGERSLHSDRSPKAKRRNLHNNIPEDGDLSDQLKDSDEVDHSTRLSTSIELSCVICWTEFSSTRGVLPCGHRFCFECIQNWADHKASMRKESTCPLCKASFASITRVDDAASLDQKIYSQTVPLASSTQDIFIVPEGGSARSEAEMSLPLACCYCLRSDPTDLLIPCEMCQISCVHSYCLDPPIFPWTCSSCRDHRFFYYH